MRQSYDFEPLPVEDIISTGIITTAIRLGITQKEEGVWECEEAEYNHKDALTEADYGPMVSAIIRARYSQDRVEAITQNYLSDPDGHKLEFDELQAWRAVAKTTASDIIRDAISR